MSWTLKLKHTRPNTDVAFYSHAEAQSGHDFSSSDLAYHVSTYKDTGKFISRISSFSENGLEVTRTYIWKDESSRNEYIQDSRIAAFLTATEEYNTLNNITKVILQDEAT